MLCLNGIDKKVSFDFRFIFSVIINSNVSESEQFDGVSLKYLEAIVKFYF